VVSPILVSPPRIAATRCLHATKAGGDDWQKSIATCLICNVANIVPLYYNEVQQDYSAERQVHFKIISDFVRATYSVKL
jgi:hypothetical protein